MPAPQEQILIYLSDHQTARLLENTALRPAGYNVVCANSWGEFEQYIKNSAVDLVILGDPLPEDAPGGQNGSTAIPALLAELVERYPYLPIILLASEGTPETGLAVLRAGATEYLHSPVRTKEIQRAVRQAIRRKRRLETWCQQEARRNTQSLEQRVSSLETLQQIGRAVTASLNLEGVLAAVVDAAVKLTGAEGGSLLLLDETTNELYMHAARNFGEDFVRTFRLPVQDTLPGQVLSTGLPVIITQDTPQKIKTSYLVRELIYVPLLVQGHAIGVLGVDNRQKIQPFTDYHLTLVSALADYAAIAVSNARLYQRTVVERNKYETILTEIKDGVVIVDDEQLVVLVNQTAREIFDTGEKLQPGTPIQQIIPLTSFLELIDDRDLSVPVRGEIVLDDGRTLSAQVTPIPEVGLVITTQDITYLKELDRIKSDFVSTVSHDLRSPLTAILGYVELIDRVGPVTEQQREFIRRIEMSVQSITALINDLLDLGRIEAGFDTSKEQVPLGAILHFIVTSLQNRAGDKEQTLDVEIPENLPTILGNPIRMRQLFTNLLGNAIKYTQAGGRVVLRAMAEGKQIIVQIGDNGPGIPLGDQPYIFDKFFRASNIPEDVPGTGLGLAIVKSIVENHQGRIWVDSAPGRGTAFTIVLPVSDSNA